MKFVSLEPEEEICVIYIAERGRSHVMKTEQGPTWTLAVLQRLRLEG